MARSWGRDVGRKDSGPTGKDKRRAVSCWTYSTTPDTQRACPFANSDAQMGNGLDPLGGAAEQAVQRVILDASGLARRTSRCFSSSSFKGETRRIPIPGRRAVAFLLFFVFSLAPSFPFHIFAPLTDPARGQMADAPTGANKPSLLPPEVPKHTSAMMHQHLH